MNFIFTAALAASLLAGTAAMAQPGDKNGDRRGEQTDRKAQKAEAKAEDKKEKREPDQAAGAPRALGPSERAADSRPQELGRNPAGAQVNLPSPVATTPVAPTQAARDASPNSGEQRRGDRNASSAQVNQAAPVATVPVAPIQAARDAPRYSDQQSRGDRNGPDMRMSQPAPAPTAAPSPAVRDAGYRAMQPVTPMRTIDVPFWNSLCDCKVHAFCSPHRRNRLYWLPHLRRADRGRLDACSSR